MNLRALHTPVPLKDADYHALRARVLENIAARKRRRRFAVAFATAAMLTFALWLETPPKPSPIVPQKPLPDVATGFSPSPDGLKPVATSHIEIPKPRHHRKVKEQTDPLRIELHTHDPDIRIIWIVPSNKEES